MASQSKINKHLVSESLATSRQGARQRNATAELRITVSALKAVMAMQMFPDQPEAAPLSYSRIRNATVRLQNGGRDALQAARRLLLAAQV